jgi:hypothetical protein
VILCRDGNIREYSYSQASFDMLQVTVASAKASQSFPPSTKKWGKRHDRVRRRTISEKVKKISATTLRGQR